MSLNEGTVEKASEAGELQALFVCVCSTVEESGN